MPLEAGRQPTLKVCAHRVAETDLSQKGALLQFRLSLLQRQHAWIQNPGGYRASTLSPITHFLANLNTEGVVRHAAINLFSTGNGSELIAVIAAVAKHTTNPLFVHVVRFWIEICT
jgi:hypothetical protein